jgi:hypothetical protein
MNGTYITHEIDEKFMLKKIGRATLKGRNHSRYQGLDNIKVDFEEKGV